MNTKIPYSKTENFQKKLDEQRGKGKFLVIGEYQRNNIKVLIKCLKCNYKWEVLPMQLTRKNRPTGCPSCSNNIRKDTEMFKKEVFKWVGDEYTVLGEYQNNSTPVTMRHNKCGKEYSVRPNDFQQGYRCPFCSHGHTLKTHDEFVKEVYSLVGDKYSVISEYKGTGEYIMMRHNENNCDYEYQVFPRNFLSNKTRCPVCKSVMSGDSKGSRKIKEYLEKNNIKFIKEKTFDDCKDIRKLKFDFYLPDYKILIEFDGNQHFKETKFLKGQNFINARKRDKIKNNWCLENNYTLLRIDEKSVRKFEHIWNDLVINRERSTTIEKYQIFLIENGSIVFNNGKYDI